MSRPEPILGPDRSGGHCRAAGGLDRRSASRSPRPSTAGDLIHGLLHGELRHDPADTGQKRRVGQRRIRRPHQLKESLALAALGQDGSADRRARALHQLVLLHGFMARADSFVSFTQRPELAAISAPACVTAPPILRTLPSRGRPRSFDDNPSDARKSSTPPARR